MDPADKPVIGKFLIDTIDLFAMLIRPGTRTFTRRLLN